MNGKFMKILLILLILFEVSVTNANQNSVFYIQPEMPTQGQNITVGIYLGFSGCNALLVDSRGKLEKNIIIDGSIIKLLTYYKDLNFCPPIVPLPTIPYQLGDLDLPSGDYTLELYTLLDGTPFPLPQNFVLNLQATIQIQILPPNIIDSSSRISLLMLFIFILFMGSVKFLKNT